MTLFLISVIGVVLLFLPNPNPHLLAFFLPQYFWFFTHELPTHVNPQCEQIKGDPILISFKKRKISFLSALKLMVPFFTGGWYQC